MTGHLAVVPARGGSKRLPRKNVLPLGGKPMLAHTIDAARESGCFDDVWVATEDAEIASIAGETGATVPEELMPAELAGDLVSSTDAALWALSAYEALGACADVLWILQPSSPLRTAADIRGARERLEEGWDHVVSVTPIDPHYFHWALRENEGAFSMWFPDYLVERPLLPSVYRPNGAIKASRVERLRASGHVLRSERLAGWEMPDERSVHVATDLDLRIASAILTQRDLAST